MRPRPAFPINDIHTQPPWRFRPPFLPPLRPSASPPRLQTHKTVRDLCKYTSLRTACLVGGDSMEVQFAELAANPDVIVATPGEALEAGGRRRGVGGGWGGLVCRHGRSGCGRRSGGAG